MTKLYMPVPSLVFTGVNDQPIRLKLHSLFNEAWAKLKERYPVSIPELEINLSPTMRTCAGRARSGRGKFQILLNYRLHLENPDEWENTFIHELGHVIANKYWGRNCGHGRSWKNVMRTMCANDERCHTMDVSAYERKQRRYPYACGCPDLTRSLSAYRHNRIQRGTSIYTCTKCKNHLAYEVQNA